MKQSENQLFKILQFLACVKNVINPARIIFVSALIAVRCNE